jgi:hypothetical protein
MPQIWSNLLYKLEGTMIIRMYEADFHKWYVQAEMNGIRVELNYDHEPTEAEVDVVMTEITKVPEVVYIQPVISDSEKLKRLWDAHTELH